MAPAIPIIIGTTLAVVSTGYAFKKFVYDPHLAPLIDAFIEQHRVRRRTGYEPIPVPAQSTGKSAAHAHGHTKPRRRRAAETFELDESRIVADERDPPPEMEEVKDKALPLISLEHVEKPLPAIQKPRTPHLTQQENPWAEKTPSASSCKQSSELHKGSQSSAPVRTEPLPSSPSTLDNLSRVVSHAESHVVVDPSPMASPGWSLASSPSLAPQSLSDDAEILSLSGTTMSYIDAETYTPRSPSPSSVAGSRVDSPAFGQSPRLQSSGLTFPRMGSPSLGQSAQLLSSDLEASDLTFPAPNANATLGVQYLAAREGSATGTSGPLSVMSWEDENWRSESEWDAMSDAGPTR